MSLIHSFACGVAIFGCVATASATQDTFSVRKTNGPEQSYIAEIDSGCVLKLDLGRADQASRGLHLREPDTCKPTLDSEIDMVDVLLQAIEQDGQRISDFKTLFLVPRQLSLNERIADCFVEDRRQNKQQNLRMWKPWQGTMNTYLIKIVTNCGVFRELDQVFLKHGAKLQVSSVEKIEDVRLKNSQSVAISGLSDLWLKRNRKEPGSIPYAAMFYFRISAP